MRSPARRPAPAGQRKSVGIALDFARIGAIAADRARRFEAPLDALPKPDLARRASNWAISDLSGALSRLGKDIEESPVTAYVLAANADKVVDCRGGKDNPGVVDDLLK